MTQDAVRHSLAERVKELTALHRTARLLQDAERPARAILGEIVAFLPDAWQYPQLAGARIRLPGEELASPAFRETPWMQRVDFTVRGRDGAPAGGSLEVCYLAERPAADEGPFLSEERDLIASLAEMLRAYLQHREADAALRLAHEGLERQVRERTAELEGANAALEAEIADHRRARLEIERYQRQLRRLATELSLAEERERRAIAADLHDHLGQALAFVKMRLASFAGDAVFCGFESEVAGIVDLVDQAIRYTRTLTCEISPPVLYELGLAPALEWLAEQAAARHALRVEFRAADGLPPLPQEMRVMLFKSAHELLANVARHAGATRVRIALQRQDDQLCLEVADDGRGFAPGRIAEAAADDDAGFGLFSIRERLRHLGGSLEVRSAPGEGAIVALLVPLAAPREGSR